MFFGLFELAVFEEVVTPLGITKDMVDDTDDTDYESYSED